LRSNYRLSRAQSIDLIVDLVGTSGVAYFVTTGKATREFIKRGDENILLFPCVGGMGHVSSIAYSYAINSRKKTVCIDGDGAFFMHLGALPSFKYKLKHHFLHFLLDNGIHQSVGGGVTVGKNVNFTKLIEAVGYQKYFEVTNLKELILALKRSSRYHKVFIRILINQSETSSLPRPDKKLTEYTQNFLTNLDD